MANADIRQLVMDGSVFYPQTDINALVNDGSFGIDDVPTAGSGNLVTSGGVASHIVYDISEANNGTSYADLSAALDNGNNIPETIRKGGMSVKFVRTSDNKYVQFRFMLSGPFTVQQFTNVTNWQGVDDVPTAGSINLVKSDGVAQYMNFFTFKFSGSAIKQNVSLDNGHSYKMYLYIDGWDISNVTSGATILSIV